MRTAQVAIYVANATLPLLHEIEAAYWREWELFGLPGGLPGFLGFHMVVVPPVLLGLVWVAEEATAGRVMSLLPAAAGVFAFSIHVYYLRRGRPQFDTSHSKTILVAILVASLAQLAIVLASQRTVAKVRGVHRLVPSSRWPSPLYAPAASR